MCQDYPPVYNSPGYTNLPPYFGLFGQGSALSVLRHCDTMTGRYILRNSVHPRSGFTRDEGGAPCGTHWQRLTFKTLVRLQASKSAG